MRLTRWLIFSIAASLLVLAACSDDGDGDGNGAPTATNVISDTPVDDSTDGDGDDDAASAFELFSALAGEWSGVWNNDTFGSSAPITMSIVVNDDGTASFSFDLPAADSGWPFDLIAVGPQAFDGTYDENGLRVAVTGDGLFGDVTVTITPDGQLTASATMEGALGIDSLTVEGTFTGDGLAVTYTVTFPEPAVSDATGSATLTKQ